MKRILALIMAFCLMAALLTGCGKTTKADLQKDLDTHNAALSEVSLSHNISMLFTSNAELFAGTYVKDSDEFEALKDEVPDMAKDAIDMIKDIKTVTQEGKALKDTLLAYIEIEKDILDMNIKAVKSGKDSDKQDAMELNSTVAGVAQAYSDAYAAMTTAINNAEE